MSNGKVGETTLARFGSFRHIALYALLAIGFIVAPIWPALVNGGPFYFPDTTAYVRGADAAFQKVTGLSSAWTTTDVDGAALASPAPPPERRQNSAALLDTPEIAPLLGRSIYYGTFVFLGEVLTSPWVTVLLQAASFVLVIFITLENLNLGGVRTLALVVGLLGTLTSVAFYTSFLMPDLFAALAVLSAANIVVYGKSMQTSRLAMLVGLLCAACLFHSSHLLLIVSMVLAAAVIAYFCQKLVSYRSVALIGLAVLVGFVGEAGFVYAVGKVMKQDPIRPPFVMARLIADGPGYDYIAKHCPSAGFKICDYAYLLPEADSDIILWGGAGKKGIFSHAPNVVKRELAREQIAFLGSVVAADPIGVAASSLSNFFKQLTSVRLEEFNYDAGRLEFLHNKLPPARWDSVSKTAAAQGSFPIAIPEIASIAALLLSIAILVHAAVTRRPAYADPKLRLFGLLIVGGLVVNAAICGMMSTPHHRYQSRLIWLLPAFVLMAELRARREPASLSRQTV